MMWKWLGMTNESKLEDKVTDENKTTENEINENENLNEDTTQLSEKSSSDLNKENLKHVAANVSNYLYSFADVATKTAVKLKETVDVKLEKTIVGDFQRENEKFIQDKEARRIGDAVAPWTGYHEENSMKKQILSLSADERNFLRDPPSGVDFKFDMNQSMPVALAALKEDDDLQKMRFKLVPKRVAEERFWRNYFYRVSLIKQSTQLSSLADQELKRSPISSSSESLNTPKEKAESHEDVAVDEIDNMTGSPTAHEFVSDAFQENEGLSEEEKNQMLGFKKSENESKADSISDNWEQEIQEELESFELVNDKKEDGVEEEEDSNWEKEIEDMIDQDEDEIKS